MQHATRRTLPYHILGGSRRLHAGAQLRPEVGPRVRGDEDLGVSALVVTCSSEMYVSLQG